MNLASRAALGLTPLLIAPAAVASMANNPDGQQATPVSTVFADVDGLSWSLTLLASRAALGLRPLLIAPAAVASMVA